MTFANQTTSADCCSEGLAAMVLAAGYSSRMGEFKPLLELDGVTALEQSIGAFRAAGVREVVAILGHRADDLRLIAERCGARCVVNPRFEEGMYSSIATGCAALPANVAGAFEMPADIPLVRPATIRQLAMAFAKHGSEVVYPVFAARRGHPPLIARSILAEIAQGAPGPLSTLLARFECNAVDVPVADEAIHMDMDTPGDYLDLRALAARREIPTAAECEAILAAYGVSPAVAQHSRVVAKVARAMASELVSHGVVLNLDLIQAGALLHDLCKGQAAHAAAGASILSSMGFPAVAAIVAAHSDVPSSSALDESAIVFLADKLVRGVNLVTLEERFQPALDRFASKPAAIEAARRRLHAARTLAAKIEAYLGSEWMGTLRGELGFANFVSGPPTACEVAE